MKWNNCIYLVFLLACTIEQPTVVKERQAPIIPAIGVRADDSKLHLENGYWYYGDSLFSGHVHAFYSNGNMQRMQTYYQGKEEGILLTWFQDGQKESERYFVAGEKDGLHKGWWENGMRRFEYQFKDGMYEGDFKEWFSSGAAFKHIEYKNGVEIRGKGWRENGKLYMSYEVKGTRRYGLMNAQPCYTLKNEKGQYIEVPEKKSPL